ncbi:MAG: VCBS repeat-containing protein [Planctomycetota bacterium]
MTTMVVRAACAAGLWVCAGQACAIDEPLRDASAAMLPLAVTNGKTMDAEFGDLNGDGRLDLVIAVEYGQNAVMLGGAQGFVFAADALPQGPRRDSEDIAIADLDGDGDLDLVFVSEDDATNELYLNDGTGVFTDAGDRLPVTGTSNAVAAFDADADGDTDLVLGNAGQNFLLINDGSARFTLDPDALPAISDTTQDIEVGDVDGDGDPDLVIANEGPNAVYLNNGSGVFTDATERAFGVRTREETREADMGDIDGDGDLDLYFANVGWAGGPPHDALLLNRGDGTFEDVTGVGLPRIAEFSLDADFADLDSDGDLDIVTARIAQGLGRPITVFVNDGAGTFTEAPSDLVPESVVGHAIDVELLDLDGDGALDIYVGCHVPSDAVLLG